MKIFPTLIILLCSTISFSQRPLTDSELRIVYEKVIKGEWCKEDLNASQEVIATLSGEIRGLNNRIQLSANYIDKLTDANDSIAVLNYGLVERIAKLEVKQPIRINATFEVTPISLHDFGYKPGLEVILRNGSTIGASYEADRNRVWVKYGITLFKIR